MSPDTLTQAGTMLHPAAQLRNPQRTMPNREAGHRGPQSSLASDRRLVPAPPGCLLPIGTMRSYRYRHEYHDFRPFR